MIKWLRKRLFKGASTIHEAVKQRNFSQVETLLRSGSDANAKDEHGWTPLHFAAYMGATEIAILLITHGAEVTIHDAVAINDIDRVKHQLKTGIDVNSRDMFDYTPLHMVRSYKMAEILLSNGADVNATNDQDFTLLHYAAFRGQANIAKILLDKGADVNTRTKYEQTPLHRAALNGQVTMVDILLANGADVNAKDRLGETPLDLSVERLMEGYNREHMEVKEILEKHGARGGRG